MFEVDGINYPEFIPLEPLIVYDWMISREFEFTFWSNGGEIECGGFWIIRGFNWFVTIGPGIWFKVGGLPWKITRELFRL